MKEIEIHIITLKFEYIIIKKRMVKDTKTEDITIQELKKELDKLKITVNKLSKQIEDNNLKNNNKVKKTKDPNEPKGCLSAYMFFNKHKIEEYKKQHPGEKIYVTKIGKQSGQEWHTLKDEEKDKYMKMAIKDKKRYEKEINTYNKNKE